MITDLNQIDVKTPEGRLLWAALIKITTETDRNKTPYEVLQKLEDIAVAVDNNNIISQIDNYDSKITPSMYSINIRFGKENWIGDCHYNGVGVISQGKTIPELLISMADAFNKADDYNKTDDPKNSVIKVAEMLYYEINPETKRDVPSYAYETVEAANKKRIAAGSELNLYDWCKKKMGR